MASEPRNKEYSVINDLKEQPWKYDFFQGVRLLLNHEKLSVTSDIKFTSTVSTSFNPGNITQIYHDKNHNKLTLSTSLVSLIGAQHILPAYYNDKLLNQLRKKNVGLLNFINILQERSFQLFYLAWQKRRYYIEYESNKSSSLSNVLLSLTGVNQNALASTLDENTLKFYVGHFMQSTRCAANLENMLKNYFKINVAISELEEKTITLKESERSSLPSKTQLQGKYCTIGKNLYLGNTRLSIADAIKITIGPIEDHIFNQFLPGEKAYNALKKLVRCYLGEAFEINLQLISTGAKNNRLQLGNPKSAKLSWSSRLQKNSQHTTLDSINLMMR